MRTAFDFTGTQAVIYKEVRHILREPITLAMIVALPLVQLLIYGYAINLHVEHIASVYYSADDGSVAKQLESDLQRSTLFRVVGSVRSPDQVRRELVSGRAHVGFLIPRGFSANAIEGRPTAVAMLVDGSDASVAQAAYGGASRISSALSQFFDPLSESAVVDIRPQMLFNPSLRTPNFLVPGIIALVIQNVTVVLTALSIVSERERGTLEQMRATPIGAGAVILGKVVPFGVVGFLDVVLVLVAMRYVFSVPIAGSVALLLALSVAFLMTGLGIGLLISTVARSQPQALIMSVFFLLPSFLLSGMFFEIDLMPTPARAIAYALPMTYFLQILRGVIIRGAGFGDLWVPAIVTVLFGFGAMAVAGIRFAARG